VIFVGFYTLAMPAPNASLTTRELHFIGRDQLGSCLADTEGGPGRASHPRASDPQMPVPPRAPAVSSLFAASPAALTSALHHAVILSYLPLHG